MTSTLASISDAQAHDIANHLTERSGIEVTAQQVLEAETLEPLANIVREGLETEVEGNIRVFREGSDEVIGHHRKLIDDHPAEVLVPVMSTSMSVCSRDR